MKSLLLLLLLALPCKAADPDDDDEPIEVRPPMERLVHLIRYGPECAPKIGVEVGESRLIPVRTKNGMKYRLAFFVVRGSPVEAQRVSYVAAVAEADERGEHVDCAVKLDLPEGEAARVAGGEVATPRLKSMSMPEFERTNRRYFEMLPRVAAAYVAGKNDAATRKLAREYRELFDLLSPPSLHAYDSAMSPGFWKWLDNLEKPKKKT